MIDGMFTKPSAYLSYCLSVHWSNRMSVCIIYSLSTQLPVCMIDRLSTKLPACMFDSLSALISASLSGWVERSLHVEFQLLRKLLWYYSGWVVGRRRAAGGNENKANSAFKLSLT